MGWPYMVPEASQLVYGVRTQYSKGPNLRTSFIPLKQHFGPTVLATVSTGIFLPCFHPHALRDGEVWEHRYYLLRVSAFLPLRLLSSSLPLSLHSILQALKEETSHDSSTRRAGREMHDQNLESDGRNYFTRASQFRTYSSERVAVRADVGGFLRAERSSNATRRELGINSPRWSPIKSLNET